MDERSLALSRPSRKRRKPVSSKAPSWLNAENLQAATAVLNTGLSLLEGNKKFGPYARALKAATSAGVIVAQHTSKERTESPFGGDMLDKLRETREALRELEANPSPTDDQKHQIAIMTRQVLIYIDLVLEHG